MQVRILGCAGGAMANSRTTSFCIDETILLDAGTGSHDLSVEQARALEAVVLTHVHIDHVAGLPFLLDVRDAHRPLDVYGSAATIAALRVHLFNDVLWPNMEKIPTPEKPMVRFHAVYAEQPVVVAGVRFTPVDVNHTVPTFGYVFGCERGSLITAADSWATERLWEIAKGVTDLRAIFIDVSYPRKLEWLAEQAKHLCVGGFERELLKLPEDVPVHVMHIKPAVLAQVLDEIASIQERDARVRILQAGDVIEL